MVCGKSYRNISFKQFYILGDFHLFTTMFKLLAILFIIRSNSTFSMVSVAIVSKAAVVIKPITFTFVSFSKFFSKLFLSKPLYGD